MTNQTVWALRFVEVGVGPLKSDLRRLNYKLPLGEWALWIEPDPFDAALYRDLAIGAIAPTWGEVLWFGRGKPKPSDLLATSLFNRRLGFTPKNGRLFSGCSLLANLLIHYVHVVGLDEATAEEEARAWLERLKLTREARTLGEKIGDKAHLALLALALVKEPDLLVLDRPRSLFERDFPLVLDVLKNERQRREFAALIIDDDYSPWRSQEGLPRFNLWASPPDNMEAAECVTPGRKK
ncbi:MAG: hypothetical protein LBS60_06615 [Deltaproteobacteria bacterium]|jgi:ABC-type branched-subunit amino acid transport system ATPase component|nr:hypothetical protein [Deltaproteobacteria bacterium]